MGKEYRILVVESEPGFAESAKKALQPGFEVALASNMGEGLLIARKEIPDLVLVGYLAPRGASFEFHKKLREGRITKDIPLLVVDVSPEERSGKGWNRDEGMQMDAEDYISRPVSPAVLRDAVGRICQKAHGKPMELEQLISQMEQILHRIDRIEGQFVR